MQYSSVIVLCRKMLNKPKKINKLIIISYFCVKFTEIYEMLPRKLLKTIPQCLLNIVLFIPIPRRYYLVLLTESNMKFNSKMTFLCIFASGKSIEVKI